MTHETEHTTPETHHTISDTVTLPVLGTLTVPGGIYTVVFGILGILTLAEVISAELLKNNADLIGAKIAILLSIAVAKAALVVLYYMHLKNDSRIFMLTLLVPLGVTLLSILYLLSVPSVAYLPG